MAHPNEERARKGFEAFSSGDMDTVRDQLADDIVWHVAGRSQLAGDYRGKDEVFSFFGKLMDLSGGSFRVQVHDVLANDEHVVALTVSTAEREGRRHEARGAQVFHVNADGQITESWFHPEDMYADDEFWG